VEATLRKAATPQSNTEYDCYGIFNAEAAEKALAAIEAVRAKNA